MLITAQHLSKTMGAKTLFTDLELHISPSEKVALIGRNSEALHRPIPTDDYTRVFK